MKAKLHFADLIQAYGVPLRVYQPTLLAPKMVAGERRTVKLTTILPDQVPLVNEPVIPVQPGITSVLVAGGLEADYVANWYSVGNYPLQTIVVNQRTKQAYQVVQKTDYLDYTDIVTYHLKEVSEDDR